MKLLGWHGDSQDGVTANLLQRQIDAVVGRINGDDVRMRGSKLTTSLQ